MGDIFLKAVNMSITAGWIVLAVVVLRLVLKKAPKWISVLLWAIVGLRLVLPFSFESILSLVPSVNTIDNTVYSARPSVQTGVGIVDERVNEYIGGRYFEGVTVATNHFADTMTVLSVAWLVGTAAMCLYGIISFLRLRKRVSASICIKDNVYICDDISAPFILGVFKPRIYLPSGLSAANEKYVLRHETAHLARLDNLWKPVGYLLLSVYWFNPLMWVAYVLLCRDIELACDEKVIKTMEAPDKKGYSEALVECSIHRRMIMACPLAFGEVGVKSRIRSVLSYKKPAIWVITAAVLICAILAVTFLTDPKEEKWQSDNYGITGIVTAAECDDVSFEYVLGTLNEEYPYIEVKWTNNTKAALSFSQEFTLYKGGREQSPITDFEFNGELTTVMPNTNTYEMYSIGNFDLGEDAKYRIEKKFWLENEPSKLYTAYVNFIIERTYSFIGRTYSTERVVFTSADSADSEKQEIGGRMFKIGDNGLNLYTDGVSEPHSSSVWQDNGQLKERKLKKSNFDELFAKGTWEQGFSAEKLRKNNLSAFYLLNTKVNKIYCLLEQKNGDIFIAYGPADKNSFTRLCLLSREENTASEKLTLDPPVQYPDMLEDFKYTDLSKVKPYLSENGETFKDEKTDIYNKMLNTIDHFNDVELTFDTTMLHGKVATVYSRTDIDEGRAYESVTLDGEVITEDYYAERVEHSIDNRNKTCRIYYHTNTERADAPYIPLAERTFTADDGLPAYVYRRNITGLPMSSFTLVPQELTFSYLADFERWSISDRQEYLGRDCVVIKGSATPYFNDKHSCDTFTMTVDRKTGILMCFEAERNGSISHFIRVKSIASDILAPIKEFDSATYSDYTQNRMDYIPK